MFFACRFFYDGEIGFFGYTSGYKTLPAVIDIHFEDKTR